MNLDNEREKILQEYSFTTSCGGQYYVKPCDFRSILDENNGFFAELKGLEIDVSQSPRGSVFLMLRSDEKMQRLNNLLVKYCVNARTKEPMNVELITEDLWDVDDIALFIAMLVGISGSTLKREKKEVGEDGKGWMYLYSLLCTDGNMTRSDVLSTSYPLLSDLAKNIVKNNAEKVAGSFLGGVQPLGMPTSMPAGTNEVKECSLAEFAELF